MLIRRAIVMGLGALIALIVAAVAGWWFFIREDNELATSPPEIPEELVRPTQTAPTAGDADGVLTFRIVPEESEAAYFVGEELASIGLPSTAKGATSEVTGEFHLTSDGALAPERESSITVDLRTLTSDEERRDRRVQEALETATFPSATFTMRNVTGYDPSLPDGAEQQLRLTGTLDLHGVQQEVTWEVEARRRGNVITALATLPFRFDEYNIEPPNIAGFVTVEDHGTLQVQLIAELVS